MDSRYVLRPGDIILVRGHVGWRHPIDDVIKFGESIEDNVSMEATYSHVAIFIGNDTVVEAQGGRLSGTCPIEKYDGNYDIGRVDLLLDRFDDLQEASESEFALPYDWLGVIWIGVGILTGYWRKWIERKTRYCATFVNDAYKAVDVELSDKRLPTPDDIANSKYVRIVK